MCPWFDSRWYHLINGCLSGGRFFVCPCPAAGSLHRINRAGIDPACAACPQSSGRACTSGPAGRELRAAVGSRRIDTLGAQPAEGTPSSETNCGPPPGCSPIYNSEFAVPFGTAAGRSFAPRRPAPRVRMSARACASQAAARATILNYEFAPGWAQQPAAAPGRRAAAPCSRCRPSARLRAFLHGITRIPQVRFERALRRLQPKL